MDKLRELADPLSPAHRHEHVVCEVTDVVPLPVVRFEECCHMALHGLCGVGMGSTEWCWYWLYWVVLVWAPLSGVGMGSSTFINEASVVVDGVVRVTLRVEIALSLPAVSNDGIAGFDPCISISAVMSERGSRNVFPDSRSTPRKLVCYCLTKVAVVYFYCC
jgi:hypothetical protein